MLRQALLLFLLLAGALEWTSTAESTCSDTNPHHISKRFNTLSGVLSFVDMLPFINGANKIVDVVIKLAKEFIVAEGHSSIEIPDIAKEFSKGFKPVAIKGKFVAKNGSLGDLSSIHRIGDAVMYRNGSNITISVELGLETMELDYDYYRASVGKLGVTGKLHAQVETNSFNLTLNAVMHKHEKCNLTVQQVKVTKLEGVDVHVEGKYRSLDWIISKIATTISNHMKEKVSSKMEKHLKNATQKALNKLHC